MLRRIVVIIFIITAAAGRSLGWESPAAAADSTEAAPAAPKGAAPDTLPARTLPVAARDDIAPSDSDTIHAQFAGRLPRIRPGRTEAEKAAWRPNPQRALWLAMVLPGAGQIYNRKYWKLPLFYGGMMGCLYAMNWNNMMYKDYSQAYLDIMDDDPQTKSYDKFLHLGRHIDKSNEERYKKIFKSRKDKYRRWRDLSFFCLLGVYAVSVIDAYVDAMLSEFDISKDLSMKIAPAVIPSAGKQQITPGTTNVGVNCRLTF